MAGLPGSTTLCQESCSVSNRQMEWGGGEQRHTGAGTSEVSSPEDQNQGEDSSISLRPPWILNRQER